MSCRCQLGVPLLSSRLRCLATLPPLSSASRPSRGRYAHISPRWLAAIAAPPPPSVAITQHRQKPPSALSSPLPLIVAVPSMQSHVNLSRIVRAAALLGVSRLLAQAPAKIDRCFFLSLTPFFIYLFIFFPPMCHAPFSPCIAIRFQGTSPAAPTTRLRYEECARCSRRYGGSRRTGGMWWDSNRRMRLSPCSRIDSPKMSYLSSGMNGNCEGVILSTRTPTLVINLPHPNPHPSASSPDEQIPTLMPTCSHSTSSNPPPLVRGTVCPYRANPTPHSRPASPHPPGTVWLTSCSPRATPPSRSQRSARILSGASMRAPPL